MSQKYLIVSILLSTIAFSTGCASDADADTNSATPVATTIVSGDYTITGIPDSRKIEVYEDQVTFNESLYTFIRPIAEETIDFSLNQVVLFSLGGRSSGGYSIEVSGVEDMNDYVKVSVLYSFPGSDCVVTPSETSPYLFIKIDTTKEIIFEESIENLVCN